MSAMLVTIDTELWSMELWKYIGYNFIRADCCSICPRLSACTHVQICTCICTQFTNCEVICPCSCCPSDKLIPSLNSKKGEQEPLKAEHWSWKQTFRIRAKGKLAHSQDVLNPFWSVKGEYSYHPLGKEQACQDWMDYACLWATVGTNIFTGMWMTDLLTFSSKGQNLMWQLEKQPLSCHLSLFLHFCAT